LQALSEMADKEEQKAKALEKLKALTSLLVLLAS